MGKLVVGIGWMHSYVPWISMSSLWMSDVRLEPDVEIIRSISSDFDASANMFFKHALDNGADEILCLSGDQSVPPDILARLRAHNKPVVGALTATRQTGHHWLIFDLDSEGRGWQKNPTMPLTKADIVGAGCLLIKADALRSVPMPWFRTTLTPDGTGVAQSSDFYFFKKLKEHGVDVYVDATLESYHLTEVALNSKTLGRKLPTIEIIKAHPFIPNTTADQDALDAVDGVYDPAVETVLVGV